MDATLRTQTWTYAGEVVDQFTDKPMTLFNTLGGAP